MTHDLLDECDYYSFCHGRAGAYDVYVPSGDTIFGVLPVLSSAILPSLGLLPGRYSLLARHSIDYTLFEWVWQWWSGIFAVGTFWTCSLIISEWLGVLIWLPEVGNQELLYVQSPWEAPPFERMVSRRINCQGLAPNWGGLRSPWIVSGCVRFCSRGRGLGGGRFFTVSVAFVVKY